MFHDDTDDLYSPDDQEYLDYLDNEAEVLATLERNGVLSGTVVA